MTTAPVDVAINVFAKPYQTALSVLSLLKFSGGHINRIFFQFEPVGSQYDHASPYAVAEYLGQRAAVYQPGHWLELVPPDMSRLDDTEYRLSIRYQFAFEQTRSKYLFVMHNDVMIKRDIIGAMLERIDGFFAVGLLGQCWNCPANNREAVKAAGLGDSPCTPGNYAGFRPDFDGLRRLYQAALAGGVFVRPYWEGWDARYTEEAWPLPECRVNEWGCLVDMEQARPLTVPQGGFPPFGAYEPCGRICLDVSVAWFRELNRAGLRARHMDISPYLQHWVGTAKMTEYKYSRAEGNARHILEKNFAPFVNWCRERKNGMFQS